MPLICRGHGGSQRVRTQTWHSTRIRSKEFPNVVQKVGIGKCAFVADCCCGAGGQFICESSNPRVLIEIIPLFVGFADRLRSRKYYSRTFVQVLARVPGSRDATRNILISAIF